MCHQSGEQLAQFARRHGLQRIQANHRFASVPPRTVADGFAAGEFSNPGGGCGLVTPILVKGSEGVLPLKVRPRRNQRDRQGTASIVGQRYKVADEPLHRLAVLKVETSLLSRFLFPVCGFTNPHFF